MHRFPRTTPLLEQVAETTVIAAWLAVPLFALLSAGRLAPPLHAAAIATLLTLALRGWRTARRGKTLHQTRDGLATYLRAPARGALTLCPHRHRGTVTGGVARRHDRAPLPLA